MRFLSITIDGFKSFARKTTINFDGSIVGVVGPNGSGKSNINDAIRWVLGSNSPTKLRSSTSQDLIFAGSTSSPPAEGCSVTLVFDNRDRSLSVDSNTVSITRSVKRGVSGSSYSINGEPAAYNLVKTLSYEVGLSKSSLAVISQGTVASLAEANPDERKLFLEETAGVAKHKLYKVETQKRLAKINLELEKAEHALREKRRYIRLLKRQAKEAEEHRNLSGDIERIDIALNYSSWFNSRITINTLKEEVTRHEARESELKEQIDASDELVENTRADLKGLETTALSLQESNKRLQLKIKELQNKIIHIEVREELFKRTGLKGDRSSLVVERDRLNTEIDKLRSEIDDFSTVVRGLKEERTTLEGELLRKQESVGLANGEVEWFKGQVRRIEEGEDLTKLPRGVAAILDNAEVFHGKVIDIFGRLISYNPKLEVAVKTVLGGRLLNIIVKDNDTVTRAIRLLKERRLGKATFFPIENARASYVDEYDKEYLQSNTDVIGIGEELISTKKEIVDVKNYYLGSVIFCKTADSAIGVAKELNFRYITVSLEGDIVRRSGEISGGSTSSADRRSGGLYDLEDIKEQLAKTVERRERLREEIDVINNNLTSLSLKLTEGEDRLTSQTLELDTLTKRLEVITEQLDDLEGRQQDSEHGQLEELHTIYKESKDELDSNEAKITETNLAISETNERIFQLLQKQTVDSSSLRDTNSKKNELLLRLNEAEIVFKSSDELLRTRYNLDPESLTESDLPDPSKLEELLQKKVELEGELAKLKDINFLALEELDRISEEYKEQERGRDEILEAFNKITETISILEEKIVFLTTEKIRVINEKFGYVFSKMFNGGEASIFFSNPEDPLNSGVEIIAKLPGKKVRNIKLFSGGEKSLIVISLLFSIILSSTLPFCVLDEVEAALDEVNLVRFSSFLRELRTNTQFIVVTHRHATMMKMDRLLGLTMQENGISSLFTVELEQAIKLVDS